MAKWILPYNISSTPSPRLSEKSWLELKSMYPTTGATTNSQSSLGVLLLLRQSSSPQTVWKVSARAEKSVPHYRATTDSQSSLKVLLLLRQSPPPQVSARVFSMYSVRISGVCLQWCIQCASQVFACKGIFRVHLRCLPAKVYSVRISGVCNWRKRSSAL